MKSTTKNDSRIIFLLGLVIVLLLILIFAISPVGSFSQSQQYGGSYLRDCEVVRQQVHAQSHDDGSSSGGQWQLLCPGAEAPIRTSFALSSLYGLDPSATCEDYYTEQGAVYNGMIASVALKRCHQEYTFEYELSMTCCTF